MYLKTLTMKGFKSFADSVDLELEPGVTVVVGPNGSGKSNVVDAIAWVLGAQAPKSVRSQKMDDVIFAGAANRQALGRAEVKLTIDNSDHALPTEFSEVEITRILFRSGDSEYALNGVPCRLLDIQELLSDSGVGRTQHVIISQGQIDAVLNARPEDRRLIIEEAAGVLKFRKRREKAQRRLAATEANQTRIKDLLREVRRQLRPLEKQADAARRHGDVIAELHACQLYLAGRQVASLKAAMQQHSTDRQSFKTRDRDLRALLAGFDTDVMGLESDLSAQGAVDLGDALARLEGLAQRAKGSADLMAERRRGLARERQATIDGDVLAGLRSESVDLARQLTEVDEAALLLAPRDAEVTGLESSLAEDFASFELAKSSADGSGTEAAAAGRAAEVRGELAALRSAVEQATKEATTTKNRLSELDASKSELRVSHDQLRKRLDAAVVKETSLVESADAAAAAHVEAQAALATARDERSEADAVVRGANARVKALEESLAAARSAAGADTLSDLDGLIGTLLDVVAIDPGWEAAAEAALGEALGAVVVDSAGGARAALETFAGASGSGAVIPLGSVANISAAAPGPNSILHHVRPNRSDVEGVLSHLLGAIDGIDGDWRAAVDQNLETGRIVVTTAGDRIGGGLWRIGSSGVGATRAAVDEAVHAAEQASTRLLTCQQAVAAQEARVETLRAEDQRQASELDGNDAEMTSMTEAVHRNEAEQRNLEVEATTLSERSSELTVRLERDTARAQELEGLLPGLESAEVASAERSRELEATRAVLNDRRQTVAGLRKDFAVDTAGLEERRGVLRRRLGQVQDRLDRLVVEETEAEQRRVVLDQTDDVLQRLELQLAGTLGALEVHLAGRREERQRQSAIVRDLTAQLESVRQQRLASETELRELNERMGRVDIDEAETRVRLESLTEMLRRDLDTNPAAVLEAPHPELPEGVKPAARARELERDLKLMGPINPLALQEFEALQERHEFLGNQLEDIRSTRRELNKVIRAIDDEIVTVFASAYADVAANFTELFSRLFPGGQGSLKLTNPDDLLETGIEVSAKPSGKNVKKLSLLSGGERSLTALAFLFAVFRSRPSPFYVMDEVEAALDDVNLHRFLSLVDEFREEAQLIIVSHQKRTMEAADTLYGVTMAPGGSSAVVSERAEVERRFGSKAVGPEQSAETLTNA